jgi:hypothetical protein
MAPKRLIAKLKNQSKFTQMIYLGGENTGAFARVDWIIASDVLGLARS